MKWTLAPIPASRSAVDHRRPVDAQPVELEADDVEVPGVGPVGGVLRELGAGQRRLRRGIPPCTRLRSTLRAARSSSARSSWTTPSAAAMSVMLYL